MAEHFLNRAQVGASLEQVRRERVTQEVRVDALGLESGLLGKAAEDEEDARPREPAAVGVEEELLAVAPLEMLSRDHPSTVNSVRSLLHKMLSDEDENAAVRRLAVLVLKNGSAQRDTVVLLEGLAVDDRADGELRKAAGTVAQGLKRKAQEKR